MKKIITILVAMLMLTLLITGAFATPFSYKNTRTQKLSFSESVGTSQSGTEAQYPVENDYEITEDYSYPTTESEEEYTYPTNPSSGGGGGPGGVIPKVSGYSKTCTYTWDSTSSIGKRLSLVAEIQDSTGEMEYTNKEIYVQERVNSGGASYRYMSGENLDIQITQPGTSEVAGIITIKVKSAGPNPLGEMNVYFENEDEDYRAPIIQSRCITSDPIVIEKYLPDLVIKNLKVYQKEDQQYGTATWIEYDLINEGKGVVEKDFINTIFLNNEVLANMGYWRGAGDDQKPYESETQPRTNVLRAGEKVHRAHRFFIYPQGINKISVKADSWVYNGEILPDGKTEKDIRKYNDNVIKESDENNNQQTVAYNFNDGTSDEPTDDDTDDDANTIYKYPNTYHKFCYYPWNAKSYIGETVEITAIATDSKGLSNQDSIKVKVNSENNLEIVSSSSRNQIAGPTMFLARPPVSLDNGMFEIRTASQGTGKIRDVTLNFESANSETNSIGLIVPEQYCTTAISGFEFVNLEEKFELERRSTAVVTDYNYMEIEFTQVSSEVTLIAKLNGKKEKLNLRVGESAEVFGTTVSLLGLENTGNNILRNSKRDFVATLLVSKEGGIILPNKNVKVSLYPEKQYTKDGTASYRVLIEDRHIPYVCENGGDCPLQESYEYELSFYSNQPMVGEFEKYSLSLPAGAHTSIRLETKTKQTGTNIFTVAAKGNDAKASTKGVLVYDKLTPPEPSPLFFTGEGFVINSDNSEGYLTKLNINKDISGNLKGKISIGKDNFEIKGTSSDEKITFSIYTYTGISVADFQGTLVEYDDFLFLTGDIDAKAPYPNDKWSLTATSKKIKALTTIEPSYDNTDEEIVSNVQLYEVVEIEPIQENYEETDVKNVYIRPVKIKRAMLFGFIPKFWSSEKSVDIEIIEGNQATRKTMNAFSETKAGNYNVRVGSLQDENNIELSISEEQN
ncbi:MAG: hypothetical protein ABIG28_01600 [archaeon]